MKRWPMFLTIGIALLAPAGLAAQSDDDPLPPGPDKDKLVKLCVGCHEMDLVVARRHTRAEWEGVMEDMLARGSSGTAEELDTLVGYLTRHFGKVNVNAASAKELEEGLKISEADAKAITTWREQHGKFKKFDELNKVPGLEPSKLNGKRGWVSFE